MTAYLKFQQFVEDLAEKVHDMSADLLTVALTTNGDPPVATDAILSELGGEIAYTNLGARVITVASSAQTTGTYKLTLTDLPLVATGAVATFQWVVIYNDSPASPLNPLISYFDHGSAVTLADGESFTLDFDGSNGFFQLV